MWITVIAIVSCLMPMHVVGYTCPPPGFPFQVSCGPGQTKTLDSCSLGALTISNMDNCQITISNLIGVTDPPKFIGELKNNALLRFTGGVISTRFVFDATSSILNSHVLFSNINMAYSTNTLSAFIFKGSLVNSDVVVENSIIGVSHSVVSTGTINLISFGPTPTVNNFQIMLQNNNIALTSTFTGNNIRVVDLPPLSNNFQITFIGGTLNLDYDQDSHIFYGATPSSHTNLLLSMQGIGVTGSGRDLAVIQCDTCTMTGWTIDMGAVTMAITSSGEDVDFLKIVGGTQDTMNVVMDNVDISITKSLNGIAQNVYFLQHSGDMTNSNFALNDLNWNAQVSGGSCFLCRQLHSVLFICYQRRIGAFIGGCE